MPLSTTMFNNAVHHDFMSNAGLDASYADKLVIADEAQAFKEAFDDITYKGLLPIYAKKQLWVEGFKSSSLSTLSGKAKIISGYSDDLPSATYDKGSSTVTPVRLLGCSYTYNIMELAQAQKMGQSLQENRALAARYAMEVAMQEIAFYGDEVSGLEGLFNHSLITRISALPNLANTSTKWYDKTAFEIYAEVNARIKQFKNRNKSNTKITDIYIDVDHYDYIDTGVMPDTDGKTILEYIEQKSRHITKGTIKVFDEIAGAGNGGTDIMMIMSKSSKNFEFKIPYIPTFYLAQIDGLSWKRPMIATCGGVVVKNENSILIVEGI